MRRALIAAVAAFAVLLGAAPASAQQHGVGEWEACTKEAYRAIDFYDPDSARTFANASIGCAAGLGADLTDPARVDALEQCLSENVRKTYEDPIGWGPLFLTSDAWRCVFIVYLGRDFKLPPDVARAHTR
jgi:hypothetical protein